MPDALMSPYSKVTLQKCDPSSLESPVKNKKIYYYLYIQGQIFNFSFILKKTLESNFTTKFFFKYEKNSVEFTQHEKEIPSLPFLINEKSESPHTAEPPPRHQNEIGSIHM